MLTVRDVAARLRCSREQVYTMTSTAVLPTPDARKPMRWREETIDDWRLADAGRHTLLNVAQVAERYGQPVARIEGLLRRGKLPPPDKSNPPRWFAARIDAWLDGCAAHPAGDAHAARVEAPLPPMRWRRRSAPPVKTLYRREDLAARVAADLGIDADDARARVGGQLARARVQPEFIIAGESAPTLFREDVAEWLVTAAQHEQAAAAADEGRVYA